MINMLGKIRSILSRYLPIRADDPTNWALLVRSNDPDRTHFIETRQNACTVWSARGEPFTMGEAELAEFQSNTEAEAFFNRTVSDNQAQGFALLHRGQAIPGSLDFGLLEDAIYRGARQSYQTICEEHRDEKIVGFALFTDFDGMTIASAAMAEGTFHDAIEEADYYRTNPSEWPYTADTGLLLAYRIALLGSYGHDEIPFEREIPNYFRRFSECCIRALERLDSDGLFGLGVGREDFLLLFGVSDGGPTRATVRRLNPDAVYRRYEHCFDP